MNDIALGLLFIKNPFMIDYCPAYKFLKSKFVVCPPLESTIYLANYTAVACKSILSLTRIESDFKNISPLKSPAYDVLNLIVTLAYYFSDMVILLGSIDKSGP